MESLAEKDGFALSVRQRVLLSVLPLSVGLLVTHDTKSYQILGRAIAQAAPRLTVVEIRASILTPTSINSNLPRRSVRG